MVDAFVSAYDCVCMTILLVTGMRFFAPTYHVIVCCTLMCSGLVVTINRPPFLRVKSYVRLA